MISYVDHIQKIEDKCVLKIMADMTNLKSNYTSCPSLNVAKPCLAFKAFVTASKCSNMTDIAT